MAWGQESSLDADSAIVVTTQFQFPLLVRVDIWNPAKPNYNKLGYPHQWYQITAVKWFLDWTGLRGRNNCPISRIDLEGGPTINSRLGREAKSLNRGYPLSFLWEGVYSYKQGILILVNMLIHHGKYGNKFVQKCFIASQCHSVTACCHTYVIYKS